MKPRIAITMGDPAGVGAEVIVKALSLSALRDKFTPIVVGDYPTLQFWSDHLNAEITFSTATDRPGVIYVVEPTDIILTVWSPGTLSANCGRAAYSYIKSAVQMVLNGQADAICTAPISKEALQLAGITQFPGHTEMLAHFCGKNDVRMMLVGGGLQVVLQSIHVALADVPGLISTSNIVRSLEMIQDFALANALKQPRIAVCGLNPHAGESGQFGREEIDIITPAVEAARHNGLQVAGPLSADTVFHRTLQGEFDFVLAMYHDQALIPVKTLDFNGGVNVTIGLPILRTSPDHGTAFNIAGNGIAHAGSMTAALEYAAKLVHNRRSHH